MKYQHKNEEKERNQLRQDSLGKYHDRVLKTEIQLMQLA